MVSEASETAPGVRNRTRPGRRMAPSRTAAMARTCSRSGPTWWC